MVEPAAMILIVSSLLHLLLVLILVFIIVTYFITPSLREVAVRGFWIYLGREGGCSVVFNSG